MALLIEQTFSQRTWPKSGDIDDCWVLSTLQSANAVAPWLPLLDVTRFRRFAGDPDDGVRDGGNVDDIVAGIRGAWPALAPLCTALRGSWSWDRVLDAIKSGRPATVCVVSAKLTQRYGFDGLHQVTYFHEPGVGLRVANPLAPDRSEPTRIATTTARDAALAYGAGKVFAVLFPTVERAFTTHPLYVAASADTFTRAQVDQLVATARAEAVRPLEARLATVRELAAQIQGA